MSLHDSITMLPPTRVPQIVSAMAASAATLTALRGLPLVGPEDGPQADLTAFTRLRGLSLRQTLGSPDVLRAEHLPASLEDIMVVLDVPLDQILAVAYTIYPPVFAALERFRNLRRIVLANYPDWALNSWDNELRQGGPLRVPPNLEVCFPG